MGLLDSFKKEQRSSLSTHGVSPVMARRIQHILGVNQLESMPVQAARAFQLASDPKAGTADFVEIIQADEALSARIIRIANSVYFYRGSEAKDIENAVANIGLNELRCLLSATMLKSLLRNKHPLRDYIWANSVATAIASRMLSGTVRDSSEGEAFLAGLLHDVGKLILLHRNDELFAKVVSDIANGSYVLDAEELHFELTHVEVGLWVGEQWNFPQVVQKVISEHHHAKPPQEGEAVSLSFLVRVADTLSHAAGIGHPATMGSLKRRAEEELIELLPGLGFTAESSKTLISQLQTRFNQEFQMYQVENN